jgi:hypothetical protein
MYDFTPAIFEDAMKDLKDKGQDGKIDWKVVLRRRRSEDISEYQVKFHFQLFF